MVMYNSNLSKFSDWHWNIQNKMKSLKRYSRVVVYKIIKIYLSFQRPWLG